VGWDQVATILITVVLAVLTGTIYNNRRIDDVHRRLDDLRADISARFAQVATQLQEMKEGMRETCSLVMRRRGSNPLAGSRCGADFGDRALSGEGNFANLCKSDPQIRADGIFAGICAGKKGDRACLKRPVPL
jgi:hypothetical protein